MKEVKQILVAILVEKSSEIKQNVKERKYQQK